MDIIKTFFDGTDNINLNIQGTLEEPLFQANQIGELLGISHNNSPI